MNKTEIERIAVLETKVDDLSTKVDGIDKKLDTALEQKADKSDLSRVESRIWWIVALLATSFIGIIVYLLQSHVGK